MQWDPWAGGPREPGHSHQLGARFMVGLGAAYKTGRGDMMRREAWQSSRSASAKRRSWGEAAVPVEPCPGTCGVACEPFQTKALAREHKQLQGEPLFRSSRDGPKIPQYVRGKSHLKRDER